MTITKLTEANEAILADINRLLVQLRKDGPSQGSIDDVREIVSNPNYTMLVVRDGEKIIGMATLYVIQKIGKRSAHVEDVVIDSEYRGQGLGEKLMREIIANAKEQKVTSLFLTSRPARVAGNKLYQKVGFKIKETNVYKMSL